MKTLALFLISLVLVTCAYADSPTISVKKKSRIKQSNFVIKIDKAFNTLTGETLTIWQSDGVGITGALISPTGKLIGKTFNIAEADNGYFCCFFGSSITYNPVLQEYFAAYTPWGEGADIVAVRLDQHGKQIGKEVTILNGVNPPDSNDVGENSFPHVIFNPTTNGYTMIWERFEGIAATLLDENGKLITPIKIIVKNPDFYDVFNGEGRIEGVQWLASGKKLLVVFQQRFSDTQTDYWLAVLDPLLQKTAKVRKINTSPITFIREWTAPSTLGILPDDTACVFYRDNEMVSGRTINRKGKFTSEPFPAFSGSINTLLHVPRVAFSTTSAGTVGLLIASERTPYGVAPQQTWAQVINDHCRPVGEAKIVDTLVNSQAVGTVLFALPRKPSDNVFQFIWMQSQGDILKLKLQVTP